MKTCSDLMTNYPPLCLPSDPVGKVAQILSRREKGPVLIIEDEQTRKLAGIVTGHDLAVKVVAVGRDPNATKISDVMTRVVAKCREDDDVCHAHLMMSELQLHCIPVVDHDDRVVGMLAHADVAAHLNQPQLMSEGIRGMLPAPNMFK